MEINLFFTIPPSASAGFHSFPLSTPKFLCGNGFPKQVKYNETLTSNYPLLPFFPCFPLVLAPVPMLTTCLSAPSFLLFFLPFFSLLTPLLLLSPYCSSNASQPLLIAFCLVRCSSQAFHSSLRSFLAPPSVPPSSFFLPMLSLLPDHVSSVPCAPINCAHAP